MLSRNGDVEFLWYLKKKDKLLFLLVTKTNNFDFSFLSLPYSEEGPLQILCNTFFVARILCVVIKSINPEKNPGRGRREGAFFVIYFSRFASLSWCEASIFL